MQKEQSDQALKLKKRARRRLVGATALVLLLVIILPMVLKDRAPSPPKDKITLSMPNESAPTIVSPSDFDSSVVPNETEQQVETPATPPSAVAKEEVKPDKAAEAIKTEAKVAKPEKQDKAEKIEKQEKIDVVHKFTVQIGVFSDPAKVKQMQAKLSDLGYQSKTEKINTDKGDKIRLKTQTFADRNEAAIALQNIKDAGLTGMVMSQ